MRILQLLAEKESEIVPKWVDQVLGAFPKETQRFFKRQKNPFANPLGHSFTDGLQKIYRMLRQDDEQDYSDTLEHLMKLKAVQSDQTPAESLQFIFSLKDIIREKCRKEWSPELDSEWPALEARIDKLALAAFDLFMASRERLFQVRIRELTTNRHLVTDIAKCPSAMMREDLKVIRGK